jgi:hypothetical protein
MKVDKTIKRVNGMILDSIGFAILFSNWFSSFLFSLSYCL